MARIGPSPKTWSGLLEALGGCRTGKPGGEAIWCFRTAQGVVVQKQRDRQEVGARRAAQQQEG